MAEGGTPTTPTTASVIGAIQAQEVVKRLHGLETLAGSGFVFEGLNHSSYPIGYPVNPDCPWHGEPPPVEVSEEFGSDTPLQELWEYGAQRLGGLDAIDLARELVASLACPSCGTTQTVYQPEHRITEDDAICRQCGAECAPGFVHSLSADSDYLRMTAGQLGLPRWDVLWARRGEQILGIELAGDRVAAGCRD